MSELAHNIDQASEEHDFRLSPTGQVCTECVMDASDPEISFDANGVCSYHAYYKKLAANNLFEGHEGARRLARIVDQVKADGKGKAYDCVMGLSGGVDSSYLAFKAVQMGLRPLVVHLDNGWNSEIAVANIEKICKRLNLDLFTYVIDWEEFKDLQLSFLKASIANAEVPTDHAIVAILYSMAARYGVKYLLSGSNISTECILPRAWGYDHIDSKHVTSIQRKFGKIRLKTYPRLSFTKYCYFTFAKGIKNL